APEALPVERGCIRAAAAAAPAGAAAIAVAVALAPLREEVLGNRRLLEVLVVGHHRRPARRGDAELRIPHGAERGGSPPRGRWRRFGVLVLVGSGDLAVWFLGEGAFLPAATAAATATATTAAAAAGFLATFLAPLRGDLVLATFGLEVGIGRLTLDACGGHARELLARQDHELWLAALR